jgi:hypothetical protein
LPAPQLQVPFWHVCPPEQTLPQVPQLLLSVLTFRQPPPQQVLAAPEQTLPQAPQLLLLVCVSMQALPQQALPPQLMSQPPQLAGSFRMLLQV